MGDEFTRRRMSKLLGARTGRRHPCEVTADRLGDHYERYYDRMTGSEREQLSQVKYTLEQLARGDDE